MGVNHMSVYFVANIKIKDEVEYKKYAAKADEVFSKFNGSYLAFDTNPLVLEGSWDYSRVVIISFPDKDSLLNWYNSKEYQEILKHRLIAADCNTIVAENSV